MPSKTLKHIIKTATGKPPVNITREEACDIYSNAFSRKGHVVVQGTEDGGYEIRDDRETVTLTPVYE